MISVVVVDGHIAIQRSLARLFEDAPGVELHAVAGSAREALSAIRPVRPDVVVTELRLPDAYGLHFVRRLTGSDDDVSVLVYSMYQAEIYARRALRAGARGYVTKTEPLTTLMQGIRALADGDVFFSASTSSLVSSSHECQRVSTTEHATALLTDREMEVFHLLGEGWTLREISEYMNIDRKTAETYRRRAKTKLGFDTLIDLVRYAIATITIKPPLVQGP